MADPKVLLLDEPTAGVYPALSVLIVERVKEIAARGVTILMVAHNMSFVSRVCHEVVVMHHGSGRMQATLEEIRKNSDIAAAYLGS